MTPPEPHTSDTAQAATALPPTARVSLRWWRLPVGLSLALLATAGALWAWSGSEGSLATTLNIASRLMPQGQTLSSAQVQGSMQHGGRLGQLHWQHDGLQVQLHNADVTLDWSQLWNGRLPLRSLQIEQLNIDDKRPPSPHAALNSFSWPVKVKLPWRIGQLRWAGPPALDLQALQGHYDFDGQHHLLKLQPLTVAQGQYSLQARLQAAAPMALDVTVQGQVQIPSTARTRGLTLQASATVQGNLSGPQAKLLVDAQLSPPNPIRSGMQLNLQAHVLPWQSQPVHNAQAKWQQLDLALLWPGAPQTRLTGQAAIAPDAAGWHGQAELTNAIPGPWDQNRLPLSQLDAQVRYQQGLWHIQQLSSRMAGGQVQAQVQQTSAGWTGQVQLTGLVPSQMHTALASGAVQGQLQARDNGQGKVQISADLSSPPGTAHVSPSLGALARHPQLRLERLHLQGLWQAAEWDIQTLDLRAADGHLQGQFKFQPPRGSTPWAAQGQLQLTVPGLTARAQGHLAAQKGLGSIDAAMQDAALSQAWLSRWPGWAERLRGLQASGPAQLKAQWQGGYEQADAPVQLTLQLPRLTGQKAKVEPWQIDPARLQIQGTLQKLEAQVQTSIQQGRSSVQVQTRLNAVRSTPTAGSTVWSAWQGQVLNATIDAKTAITPNTVLPWRAQLAEPVSWQWRRDTLGASGRWGAGVLALQGPSPGQAQVSWNAGQWSAPIPGHGTKTELSARLDDLPMTWLSGIISPDLQSDVLLQGTLNWSQQDSLHVKAVLERSRGDLRLATDGGTGQKLSAGLRTARLQLQIDGVDMQAQLAWDSEQMGQAQAQAQTRLSATAQGWTWPEQAPLSGQLQANLPRVDAWSLLAPPGWRVQGTLDAHVTLSGTLAQPQWQGFLQADKLAVRSAVEGIEFNQGQLRAQLQGQQVELTQLSLRGAGAQGGELKAGGLVKWLPPSSTADKDPAHPWGEVDMALHTHIQNLRVSNRADRRLTLSGDVKAVMQQGRLQLRGQVQADQALFILPEDNTPTLGSDVVILGVHTVPAASTPPTPRPNWLGIPDVQVGLDLGPDFQVRGLGLNTRLAGQVTLVSNAASQGQPRLTGQVRTEGGRYKAYGQQLEIENGLLRFNGPYDNPSLDILALRPNLSQRVGVQITGTALQPRIRLYSDPEMPDADKLAWLVLGRSAAGGGAESAVLQQAALALLGGNGKTLSGELASALGLDEISLAQGSRSNATATGAAVTLGKRLSKDFYIVYETSLRGTFGSFYVFYDLSRRLTLRAQTGQDNALDLIYTIRKD
ncbi:hypothetical protein B9Z51_10275 [Limnohabitans sp. T6-5]|uniref:translocation/assembly module TamB domain-containing protein n=1 Tax=Limnohabitans sp. T6-5 TaxID=1100724 RepID=UPI000D378298|nr:translocation/assembly module TamB domain-containing protein [Limnohabitans sp. T6-5]PUE09274.1 hypothetical protein B9Z51_10275 [Limnohabitans sp. T6-5]